MENNKTTILEHNERLSALVEQVEALPDAVNAIIEPLAVTKNGTYEPEDGISGFSPVTVNVPTPKPVLEPLTVNANGTYTPSAGTDGYSSVIVNVPSSGGGGGAQIQTGEFTLSADATQYTVSGLPFRPKWFVVKGSDFGSAGVARTAYWQKNAYTGETVTSAHKGTNVSITTVLGTSYATFDSTGFTVKQYLALPIIAGTYTWVAMTDE